MQPAVAYYRTSSAANVGENKDSARRQREACLSYAGGAGLAIVAEFYDANVAGKDPIGARDGFARLLEFCREKNVRVIVFETASRFSRDQVIQELGYRELRALGFELACADAPGYFTDDTDNPSLKMIRQILGAVAEFQKDELVLKLRGARRRKRAITRAAGITTADGRGKVEGRKSYLEKNPGLVAAARRLARKNPRTGRRRSLREISTELHQLGHANGKGTPLAARQVQRLLLRKP